MRERTRWPCTGNRGTEASGEVQDVVWRTEDPPIRANADCQNWRWMREIVCRRRHIGEEADVGICALYSPLDAPGLR